MKTRMQPIGNAWANLPRLIRDLSLDRGKKVELRMIGAETELDRQVLELVKDPLTHMVRNSVDHGIELPEVRKRAGKRGTGEVVLNAYHEGGHIIIEIGDDGRGIDLEAIKNKAIENGMASAAEVEAMSDQQALKLIFKPGFSTATEVTNVSGRSVGMAIVSVFIVECGGERFAIPQISVVELVRVSAHSEHTIEMINNAPVLRLRDRLLPLVSLSQILKLGNGDATVSTDDDTFIVVSQVGAQSFGIIVDKVFDTEEIVVKPVAPMLRDIGVFSGNTILGDGSIVMILDPNGIAATATHTSLATSASGTALGAPVPARRNAAISLRALTAGASDYMPKPTSARDLHATDGFRRELLAEVEALGDPAARRERRSAAPLKGAAPEPVSRRADRPAPAVGAPVQGGRGRQFDRRAASPVHGILDSGVEAARSGLDHSAHTAHHQGLYAHRLRRAAQAPGTGRAGQGRWRDHRAVHRLIEGGDHNEPISDAVRGILDGHIVLDRAIADRGRFPAVNVLRSVSRTMPHCNSEAENRLVYRARALMATYEDMAEMIRLGAYRAGSNAAVDEAIRYHGALEAFLAQDKTERSELAAGYAKLAEILEPEAQ